MSNVLDKLLHYTIGVLEDSLGLFNAIFLRILTHLVSYIIAYRTVCSVRVWHCMWGLKTTNGNGELEDFLITKKRSFVLNFCESK